MICPKHRIPMHKVAIVNGIWQWKCSICEREKGVSYGKGIQSNNQTKDSREKKPNAGTGIKSRGPRTKI